MQSLQVSSVQSVPRGELVGSERLTVADTVVRLLSDAGVRTVFGVPGGATVPLHASMSKHPQMEFILTAHEGGAAYMADCYARVSGKLGVCCATTGPGATNLLTGVASARQDSVPMLVLTGMNPTESWGRGDFQECSPYWHLNTVELFRSVCKLSEVVVSEKVLQHRLRNAIATALKGRPGPVHIAIPRDMWSRSINYEEFYLENLIPQPPSPSPDNVRRVAELMETARRPLIIFGSGANEQSVAHLFKLSKHYAAPIVSTPRAKGKWFEYPSKYYLGSMGIAASTQVDALIESTDFDVILAIGAGFGSYSTNSWDQTLLPSGAMIQVNIDPDEIGRNYPATIGIVADAATFTRELVRYADEHAECQASSERRAWAESWVVDQDGPAVSKTAALSCGVHPADLVFAADKAVGENGILMADSSSILLWATHHLPDRARRRFLSVWGWASMGHVTAGAVGAKLASPHSDVVVLTGDGCFLMHGNEVATAVSLGLNIVWVINTNTQLGMIHYELRQSGNTESATLGEYDFAKFAQGVGAHGVHCADSASLEREIVRGLKRSLPTVIQVKADPGPTPPMGNKKLGSSRWQEYFSGI